MIKYDSIREWIYMRIEVSFISTFVLSFGFRIDDIWECDIIFTFPKMWGVSNLKFESHLFYQYKWSTIKVHIFSFFFIFRNKRKRHSCGNLQALKEKKLTLNKKDSKCGMECKERDDGRNEDKEEFKS